MNEFNEFIVKISEIRKYMFLTLVFLFFDVCYFKKYVLTFLILVLL